MAGWGPISSLSRGQRAAIIGVALALLITTLAVIRASGDHQQAVRAEDDTTSTTEDATTTTDAETTTTTTEASTTTTVVVTTTPPITAPPATQPPPTTAPPAASLDMSALLVLAKANATRGTAPHVEPDAPMCPAATEHQSDSGDDAVRDIGQDWYLVRHCNGIYRLALPTNDTTPLDSFWAQIDTGPGGCGGIDRVVIGWHDQSGPSLAGRGVVISTPGCGPGTWAWTDSAEFPVFNAAWLQLTFREGAIGSPRTFHWRGAVRGAGESGASIDKVPNAGPEHFVV